MDLINSRTRQIGELALDGLYERQKAIASNTVNALTPNYQRKEVSFEYQLQDIINKENQKEEIKIENSVKWQKNPSEAMKYQDPAQIAFLARDAGADFKPEVLNDLSDPIGEDGNNVNIEREMMSEAETGMRYSVVSKLMSKSYEGLKMVIKGQIG